MIFYEFDDFLKDPSLAEDKEACESLLAQLLVSATNMSGNIRQQSRQLYQLLFIANKYPVSTDLKAPAAVNITDKGMNLYVNFNYIQKGFGQKEYLTVLLHEALHLLYLHPITFREDMRTSNARDVNIALDAVINQQDIIDQDVIDAVHGISYNVFCEYATRLGYAGTVKRNSTSQYYLDILKQVRKDNDSKNGKGDTRHGQGNPSHDKWGEGEDGEEQLKGVVRQLKTAPMTEDEMREIIKTMSSDLPANLSVMLETVVEKNGVVLRLPTLKSVITKVMRDERIPKRTIRAPKPDNGTGVIKKGFKRRFDGALKVYFYGDTSGSIDFNDVANTVATLAKQKDKVDAELFLFSDEVYPYNPDKVYVGGTDAQAVFNHLRELNVDKKTQVVIFSDGYIFGDVRDNGYTNTLWVLTKDGTTKHLPKGHKHVFIAG